ncbi:MAG: mannitol dehydrogenase family protein [Thermomicrobia bacterium]|nr:mannitol dehydrogenase family protein [Thermomicrobia bacterium]
MENTSDDSSPATELLANDTLGILDPRVVVPTYDRSSLTPAIAHFSVGGFHRSHQLLYLDELAQRGITMEWGVTGIGLRRPNMRDALASQDNLYTVLERGDHEDQARVVGVLMDYLLAPDDPAAVLALLADARTRLVTLTITRDGYYVDPTTGKFLEDNVDVVGDLDHPDHPATAFGYICEALNMRRLAGLPPFTVLSCDNMQDNGAVARTAAVSLARLRDEALARWIEENVAFPGSMVDRITPETTADARDDLRQEFGVDDHWPVITEPFTQWVIQDTFSNGRPPLERVGVQFVADVEPYELMKTRLLNASHCALGYLGYLAGYRRTDEAMADPLFASYLAHFMDEVTPLLPPIPGIDLVAYKRTLLERFANPKIADFLERLCARGSTKMPTYLLPSIREALERGQSHVMLTLAVAGWCRYLRGVDDAGEAIEIKDARKETLQPLAEAADSNPRPLLSAHDVFDSLGQNPAFVASLEQALHVLDQDGVRAILGAYLAAPVAEQA